MCRFTRQEFIQGCKAMNVDSIKVRFLRECTGFCKVRGGSVHKKNLNLGETN